MTAFFLLKDTSFQTKGFAWASGFGLLKTPMPFLHPAQLAREIEFSKINPAPPGIRIDPGASTWPDFLGHGGGTPEFFVSDRVLDALHMEQLPVTCATEMPMATINSKRLRDKPPPRYFVIETEPGIEIDFAASGIPTDERGKPIMHPLPKPWPAILKLRANSWNGKDLLSFSNFWGPPFTKLLCTERVVGLAERQGWTNCRFEPIETV